MSERMTSIDLPGVFNSGWADYGRKTPAEMIAYMRRHAEDKKREAEAVLAAADADFRVETYRGIYVKRDREVLQAGLTVRAI